MFSDLTLKQVFAFCRTQSVKFFWTTLGHLTFNNTITSWPRCLSLVYEVPHSKVSMHTVMDSMWIHHFHFKVVAEGFPSGSALKKTYTAASSPQISSQLCIKSVRNFILFYFISLLFIQYNFIATGVLILKRECKSYISAIIWSLSSSFVGMKCSLLWHKYPFLSLS